MYALSVMNVPVAAEELLAEAVAGARDCQNSSSALGSSSPSMAEEVLFAPVADEEEEEEEEEEDEDDVRAADAEPAEESKATDFNFGAEKLDAGCKMFGLGTELLEDEAPLLDDAGAAGALRALPITNADGWWFGAVAKSSRRMRSVSSSLGAGCLPRNDQYGTNCKIQTRSIW